MSADVVFPAPPAESRSDGVVERWSDVPAPPEGGTTKLSPADLRRILHALLVSVLEVRQMVAAASTTLSVDDYGDALLGATRRLEQMEACVQGLLAAKVAFPEAEGGAA